MPAEGKLRASRDAATAVATSPQTRQAAFMHLMPWRPLRGLPV
jgi:hypothetical protein